MKETLEQPISPKGEQIESEQEKRARLISHFIEKKIIGKNKPASAEEEKEIQIGLKEFSSEEKSVRMYEDLIAAILAKTSSPSESLDPYLVSEIKETWSDEAARQVFLKKYGETRIETKQFRIADLIKKLVNIENNLSQLTDRRAQLKQDLRLKRVTEPDKVKAIKSKLSNTLKIIERLLKEKEDITKLRGYEHVAENTDAAAIIMYNTLTKYHEQAKAGFVWLPSRQELHKKIIDTIENTGKSPLLIGPPGTGKTTQIDAVARELTGESVVKIPCSSSLGEEGLVAQRDIKGGEGTYDYRGGIAEAYTGFLHSQDKEPSFLYGRIANLDEISQLNLERALAAIKDIRLAKEGKALSRYVPNKVLPGAFLTATSNLPIADERLEREFGRVPTNYFEMSENNPELYEFMLSKLLQDEGHFPPLASSDIEPKYEKKEIPEDQRKVLENKNIVVATQELVKDQNDPRHGFLYRLVYAIRAIQDSYIHGSKFNEKNLANTAFYEDFDDKGNIIIKGYVADLSSKDATSTIAGEMLKLESGSSTLTPEIISKWLDGFASSGEKDFPQWMQRMLEDHIRQTSHEDGERIQAICNYFHLFDQIPPVRKLKLYTPKEIGYLSPRVPRPVYLEKPTIPPPADQGQPGKEPGELKERTKQVLLEDGAGVSIKEKEISIDGELVKLGEKIRIKGEDFSFAGIVEDINSPHNGKPVGKLASGEELYSVFNVEELNLGISTFFKEAIAGETGIDDFKEDLIDYWESEGCKKDLGEFAF